MTSLKGLSKKSQLYEALSQQGWLTDSFISVLTIKELQSLITKDSMEDSKDSYKNLEIYLQNVKIKQKINNNYKKNPSEKNSTTLSTSSFNIDNILDSNGLKAGEITLFYGKFRTGKTQMGFNACCEIYKHFSQEKSKKLTLFIDTEGTFRPERISEIALFKRISPDDLLKSIYVVKVQAISELKLVFGKIEEIIEQEKIQLIIIDSLTSLFRVELGKDDKESYQVIGELVKTLDQLSKLLKAKHIPALCTSQVSGNVGDIRFFDVSPILPAILNIYIKQWILLSEDENEYSISDQTGRRCAHLINSQEKKEEIVKFRIVSGGIEDIF